MTEKKDGPHPERLIGWDGDQTSWPDYVRKVRLTWAKTPKSKRKHLGPGLAAALTGKAWDVSQEVDHKALRKTDGAKYLLTYLESKLGKTPVPDAGLHLEELFIKMRRTPGQTMAMWANKVREVYRKVQRALQRARRAQGRLSEEGKEEEKPEETFSGRYEDISGGLDSEEAEKEEILVDREIKK